MSAAPVPARIRPATNKTQNVRYPGAPRFGTLGGGAERRTDGLRPGGARATSFPVDGFRPGTPFPVVRGFAAVIRVGVGLGGDDADTGRAGAGALGAGTPEPSVVAGSFGVGSIPAPDAPLM